MKKKKNGFTLVELLATIVILGIVMTIGGFAISSIITSSKDNNQKMLASNIKSAAEMYYQDCKHNMLPAACTFENDSITIKLANLISIGYLTSNKTKEQSGTLYDPKTGDEISNCTIKIQLTQSKIHVYKDSDTATDTTVTPNKTVNCIERYPN